MMQLKQALCEHFKECVEGHFADGIDNGEWLFSFGDEEYVVEYVSSIGKMGATLTLSQADNDNDDHTVKHKFVIKMELVEVK